MVVIELFSGNDDPAWGPNVSSVNFWDETICKVKHLSKEIDGLSKTVIYWAATDEEQKLKPYNSMSILTNFLFFCLGSFGNMINSGAPGLIIKYNSDYVCIPHCSLGKSGENGDVIDLGDVVIPMLYHFKNN